MDYLLPLSEPPDEPETTERTRLAGYLSSAYIDKHREQYGALLLCDNEWWCG